MATMTIEVGDGRGGVNLGGAPRGPANKPSPILDVLVVGHPKGEKRHRTRVVKCRDGRVFSQEYPDHSVDGWRQLVCCALVGNVPRPPLDGPGTLVLHFTFARPKRLLGIDDPRHELPYTAKPDADNLAKLVKDQMTKMLVWNDDAQVTDMLARKRYVAIGANPGCRIQVYAGVDSGIEAGLFEGNPSRRRYENQG